MSNDTPRVVPRFGTLHCDLCNGPVSVELRNVVIDDDCGVYRVSCPQCSDLLVVDLTVELRNILRSANVKTVNDLVSKAHKALESDVRIREGFRLKAL